MKPLFEIPQLLTLDGSVVNATQDAASPGCDKKAGGCDKGCSGGCANGCESGAGDGMDPD